MSAHARWTYVCRLSDIVPNTGVAAMVAGRQVAVFRLAAHEGIERVYALCNRDPRSRAYVLARGLLGDVQGRPVVAAPIYKQHYDLVTGECLEDPALSVAAYAVRVFDGMVLVRAEALKPVRSAA